MNADVSELSKQSPSLNKFLLLQPQVRKPSLPSSRSAQRTEDASQAYAPYHFSVVF